MKSNRILACKLFDALLELQNIHSKSLIHISILEHSFCVDIILANSWSI